jgi:hypothetical protein
MYKGCSVVNDNDHLNDFLLASLSAAILIF